LVPPRKGYLRTPEDASNRKPVLFDENSEVEFRRELIKAVASPVVHRRHCNIVAAQSDALKAPGQRNGEIEDVLEAATVDDR
jgi:hypothetical protein